MNSPSTEALTLLATVSHRYGLRDGWFRARYRWAGCTPYRGHLLDSLEDADLITVAEGCWITPTPLGMVYAKLNAPKPGML